MNKEKVQLLEKIYLQQHYFIDRHDSMAERFMSILLIEATCFAFIFSTCAKDRTKIFWLTYVQYFLVVVFLLLLFTSLIKLFLIVRPLSKKARDNGEVLLKTEHKQWIDSSFIYYQGIIARIQEAKNAEKVPSQEYINQLDDESLGQDYLQQIFILSQYSKFKKEKLEVALKWIIGTSVFGVLATISFLAEILFMS